MKIMKKTFVVLFVLMCSIFVFIVKDSRSQNFDFVPIDGKADKLLKFYSVDTIIVITPNDYTITLEEKRQFDEFTFWKKSPIYLYKKVHNVDSNDFKKHIVYYGKVSGFSYNIFKYTPFKKVKNGFTYEKHLFANSENSFYYINNDADKVFILFNKNILVPSPYSFYLSGGPYQLYVFDGYKTILTGFDKNDNSSKNLNNMDSLRKKYFNTIFRNSKYEINVGIKWNDINVDSLISVLDNYQVKFCSFLKLNTKKMPQTVIYLYNNREDLQNYIAAPNGAIVYGKSMVNINHIMNIDMGIIKHEIGHTIIHNKIGFYSNGFFSEGFRQYTDYLFDANSFHNDFKVCLQNMDYLTPDILTSNYEFYKKMDNYAISGIVVRYLISNIGLGVFKYEYSKQNLIPYIQNKYGSLNSFLIEFKKDFVKLGTKFNKPS